MSRAWIHRPTPLLLILTGGMAAFASVTEIQALQGPLHFPPDQGKRMLAMYLAAFAMSLGPSLGVFSLPALGPALRGSKGRRIRFALLLAGALLGSIPIHAFWVQLGQRAWASPHWLVDVGFLLVTNIALVWLTTKDASARAAASEGKRLLQETLDHLDSARLMSLMPPSQRYAEILDLLEARIAPTLDAIAGEVELLRDAPTDMLAERLPILMNRLDLLREEEVRRLSHQLHPSVIDVGMVPAFHFLAERLLPDLTLELDLPGATTDEPPAETRLVIYRCVEEVLSRARRHSEVTRATLRWEARADGWHLAIRPSLRPPCRSSGLSGAEGGTKLRCDPEDTSELGLRMLESRVHLAGGSWSLETGTGIAASLDVFIPRANDPRAPSSAEPPRFALPPDREARQAWR